MLKWQLWLVTLGLTVGAALPAVAAVKPAALFCDNMVLQCDAKVPVWGTGDDGEQVTVRFRDQEVSTVAKGGKWILWLAPLKAGEPAEDMTLTGNYTITIRNVQVGEVWICSGQSNMQMSVSGSNNAQEEIAAADYPNIRLFTVARKPQPEPVDDCVGNWSVCSPQAVGGFSAVGYFFGRCLHKELDVPVGLINSSWGGTIAEAWTSRETLQSDEAFKAIVERRDAGFKPGNPNQGSVLYNGMIHPLLPYAIRGAIWYQGESNRGRAEQYAKLFPAMITDWRKSFGQGDFPFLFVQLAPFRYGGADPAECAELWEAQLKTLSLANTGMAVTTDIGNFTDIHPKNKQDVGKRLALWALAKTFGQELVYSGPLYDSMSVEGDKIRVKFQHVGGGLVAKGGPLAEFTIAGEDQKFVPAEAVIDGDAIVVHSDEVARPVAVRFAWNDTPTPNLFNKEGLPASPFRTDDFPMVTAGRR
ncbi:MAG: 9-O-acetylesterase [Pirellulales bacterium]|nr:9-O-acetylesterase [Pirellulales bacterium]